MVRSCLLITLLIKCLKGHKSLGSVVLWRLWLLVVPDQLIKGRPRSPIELFWTAQNKVKWLKRKKVLERKGVRALVIAKCSLYHTAFYYKGFYPLKSQGSAYGYIVKHFIYCNIHYGYVHGYGLWDPCKEHWIIDTLQYTSLHRILWLNNITLKCIALATLHCITLHHITARECPCRATVVSCSIFPF